jgi:hypothetical protein
LKNNPSGLANLDIHNSKEDRGVQEKQVVVGVYKNEINAEIAKGHLEASGIPALLIKDDGGGMFPSLQSGDGVQLLVAESQKTKAMEILKPLVF